MIEFKKSILGVCLMALMTAVPATAKVTIGLMELNFELKNATEVMDQIKKMKKIKDFKNTMCGVLGAEACNAFVNQVATCTKSALKKLNKDIVSVDKENLKKAASSCASDLYISECIDAGYDALDDLEKKKNSLSNIVSKTEKKTEKFKSNTDKAYTNALTGDTVHNQITSTSKSIDQAESLYKQLGGGDVSKSYIGSATQGLFKQATTATKNMELVKSCSMDALNAADWMPSVTTLTPSEMAPTVPATIKAILVNTEEGAGDLLSKAKEGGSALAGGINNLTGGVTGAADGFFGTADDLKDGYDTAVSLYKKGDKVVTNLGNAEGVNDALAGTHDAIKYGKEVGKKTGIDGYFDPLNDQTQEGATVVNEKIQSSWKVVAASPVGQVGSSIKSGIESGSAAVTGVVSAANDKVTQVEEKIAALVLAGMKKTTDAGAGLILGTPDEEETDINDARNNQNMLQINALSAGVGSGKKSSALVVASGEELEEKKDKIQMAPDVLIMLKEIAGVSAQSLQKNNAITAMKAQLLEMGALNNIVEEGVLEHGG